VGVEADMWTRDTGDIGPLLPRADAWDGADDFFEFSGDGWLLTVTAPEEADPGEVPAELRALAEDLRYRVGFAVEPSNPDPGAWELLRQTMESIGRKLGGVGHDPESGHARSFAD
jgi:hypothetical protein